MLEHASAETNLSSSSSSSQTARRSFKAKAPPPPAPKAKGGAKAKGLPAWQGPRPGLDWKAERVVNWQPIRNEARWNGSVWEKIHNSMQGQINLPPDKVLERFMRKPSEVPNGKPTEGSGCKVPAQAKRLLPRQNALIADIHHALLIRKGFSMPYQLCWVFGRSIREDDHHEEKCSLPEDVLEAVSGLLDAAASAERVLREATIESHLVRSEDFLRIVLQEYGELTVLQTNVRMVLYMLRFPVKIAALEQDLTSALCAVSGVMNSSAMPVLLEGFLLLGNSVNANSRNLGGAVGVTLDSLAKLANTKCLSDKKGGANETALLVLVHYLEEGRPDLAKDLARDLDACIVARDFDQKMNHESVAELASLLGDIEKRLLEEESLPVALAKSCLQDFTHEANTRITSLRELQEELDDATDDLRRWFAESADCTLANMLQSLAALRVALPVSRPSAPKVLARPKRTEGARPRKSREQRKSESTPIVQPQTKPGVPAQCKEPLVSQDSPLLDDQSPRLLATAEKAKEAPVEALDIEAGQDQAISSDLAPHDVVAQILSMKKGTVWVNWFFDWAALPQKLSGNNCDRSFEVSQRRSDGYQTCAWNCQKPPLKLDLPAGFCYTFMVRAFVHSALGSDSASEQTLWVSCPSDPVDVDLRILESAMRPDRSVTFSSDSKQCDSPSVKSDKSYRRSRVASSIGTFLGMLKDPVSPGSCLSPAAEEQKREDIAPDLVSISTTSKSPCAGDVEATTTEIDSTEEPLQLLIRTLSIVQPRDEVDKEDISCVREEPLSVERLNYSGMPEIGEVMEEEGEPEDLKQLALAFDAIERLTMQAVSKDHPCQEDTEKAHMSSMEADTPAEAQSWEQSISDNDACALRHLARALSTLDGDDISWITSSTVEDTNTPSLPLERRQPKPKSIRKTSEDDLPDGNEVLAAVQRHYSGQSGPSTQTSTDLPNGNEVLATMQRSFSDHSRQSDKGIIGIDALAPLAKSPERDDLVDGNEVLAAMGEKLRRDQCKICGGTGKVGLLGGTGLGFVTKPCECVAQAEASSVRNPFGKTANPPSSFSSLAQATRSKMPFTGNIASFAQSTTSKMPFLSAPLWAAPSRSPSYKLSVRLGENKVEVLEFEDAKALPKRIEDFLARHHLMPRFSEPLRERAEGMIRYEVIEDAVDIVDLV